uniref:Calcium release activated channel regulator 2B n=1 Tax=Paramormyrops kingsleyae TaxID=1676925 RepID=A0A3B3Q1T3_9TELE|nr:EF-hand calcium-binding domain-containing protein 4A isoform X1 [Paramormyrops kingsleyae]XP_023675383.1 EF-hand calcium-binding domain-containing protein 4A isoform X1 [Paramormyrops kingsleyae]XP_023675385.1 EF-hand calcium-binding domain-containing protein 4A isoform X1 [Paramormyrops kingsleyae]XP_023675386.1 EF-hand calcium-binding domain-containing protein 4A isoform X1 [Paramormyrops kingsleyae]
MSGLLVDGEVFVGEARGEMSPCSPRRRACAHPRAGRGRRDAASLSPLEEARTSGTLQREVLGKATELFLLCDKERKGFITKRDMLRLQGELPLTAEQLESVFESLDQERNGFLTPVEFRKGLGELVLEPEAEVEEEVGVQRVERVNPDEQRFTQTLVELGVETLLKDGQWEAHVLWRSLRRDHPELLCVLEELLSHAVSQMRDAMKERDSLEHALRRRELDHDQVVRSIYEEMENQVREEKEKRHTENSVRESDRCQQLREQLRIRGQELELAAAKQKELEDMVRMLSSEQMDTREQNQKVQYLNQQLQEQLESSRAELESVMGQLQQLQSTSIHEQRGREGNVFKVSKNMQKEKESLVRQLELLREMNKRMRDEKDVHQSHRGVSYRSSFHTLAPLPQCSWENGHPLWLHTSPPYWPYPPPMK